MIVLADIAEGLYASQPAKTLYHYTSLDALQSILSSRGLWATDVHYFTDSAELNHCADTLVRLLRVRSELDAENREVLNQLSAWVKQRALYGPMLFATSFTENGNLLSQWRGYCSIGRGISLGFSPSHIFNCASSQRYRIGRCIYDQKEQDGIAEQVIDSIVALARDRGPSPPNISHPSQAFHPLFIGIEEDLLRVQVLLKNPCFAEESEWRTVSPVVTDYAKGDISYRTGVSTLIPYKVFSLDSPTERMGIEHVYLGPTPHNNLSMYSLMQVLTRAGVKSRQGVRSSQLPYREI